MKTAQVSTKRRVLNNKPALRKVHVNHALSPFKKQEPKSTLSIRGYELNQWLAHLNGQEGVYFIDLQQSGKHALHYKQHGNGKLMELEQKQESILNEESTKDWLEALLFDLSLFQDAPILAFDADMVEDILRKLGAIYYEHRQAIETVIGRLVNLDMKKLFATGVYHEPRIRELTIDNIYQSFFTGTSRSFKEQGSYAMYLIYQAIQSIFYQIIGKSIIS